jgi:hypothetical protein
VGDGPEEVIGDYATHDRANAAYEKFAKDHRGIALTPKIKEI